MKRVRFENPEKPQIFIMNDSECHSPRPFVERELRSTYNGVTHNFPKVLPYSSDPIQRYETSNSSPYPMISRTSVSDLSGNSPCWQPCDDLNLSLLDASNHEPRQPAFCRSILKETDQNKICGLPLAAKTSEVRPKPLTLFNGTDKAHPPNVLIKDNSFFIKRDNLNKYNFNQLPNQFNGLNLGKENDPIRRKTDMMKNANANVPPHNQIPLKPPHPHVPVSKDECMCHHCCKTIDLHSHHPVPKENLKQIVCDNAVKNVIHNCACSTPRDEMFSHCNHVSAPVQPSTCKSCNCQCSNTASPIPQNAIDKKTWAIQNYEKSNQPNGMEVEKQTNVSKEKREPTVADLFKIIKLQNEQLQLLQEKVDKFMSSNRRNTQPTITCSTEHVAVNAVEHDDRKMSVGVMTSFEMIRTSTVINKEVVTQTNDNAQIQCNRSQISIKEVVSKPVNMNFLDGIIPKNVTQNEVYDKCNHVTNGQQTDIVCEEKTLNELSLYNVQVDNATTPLMSPEQTLYLDVRDYSDSEASSNNQSNVGWTYYNKVMTHVNGMLQDSEMPSSASAMYRNMRQQCIQMNIDKTNVSVTKRVKFGDDPLGLHQPHLYAAPSTDTSLKMNQLAAKYLKTMPAKIQRPPPTNPHIDMSMATRNYMEKHRLLQGFPAPSKSPQSGELPRFLDITALKQQPKFL